MHLPHDFLIERNFTSRADKVHGYLPYSKGWYRRALTLPASDAPAAAWLTFDGVQRNSVVYLNGEYLCSHLSGGPSPVQNS